MRRARGCLDLLRGGGFGEGEGWWASERIACVISGFGGGKGVFCRYPIQFVLFVSALLQTLTSLSPTRPDG